MARSFNGTSDLIDCGFNSSLDPTGDLTISCWAYPTALSNAYSAIISRDRTGSTFFQIFAESTGKAAWYIKTTSGGTASIDPGTITISTGNWYNFTLVYTNASGIAAFINGSSDGTAASVGSFSGSTWTSAPLQFANDSGTAGRNFGGRIADIGIWNTGLSNGEVAALARGARPYTIRPKLFLGYWPLDGLASPEPDLSGNKNSGTLTGTALASGPPIAMFTPRWPQNSFAASSVSTGAAFQAAWAAQQRIVSDGIGI